MNHITAFTEEEQRLACHAIGYSPQKQGRRKTYEAYRNYHAAPIRGENRAWENMVEKKLAVRGETSKTLQYYHVSDAGIQQLSRELGVKIRETD